MLRDFREPNNSGLVKINIKVLMGLGSRLVIAMGADSKCLEVSNGKSLVD